MAGPNQTRMIIQSVNEPVSVRRLASEADAPSPPGRGSYASLHHRPGVYVPPACSPAQRYSILITMLLDAT